MLQYSPSADWYMLAFMSGWSLADGTSSTTQRIEVGYQGHAGPRVSLALERQLLGIAEFDTTTFTLGTSLHDVSAQFNYTVATSCMVMGGLSVTQTLHSSTLGLTFPGNGREDSSLSGDLSLIPLAFVLSYVAEL
jgi:hypothetical protein